LNHWIWKIEGLLLTSIDIRLRLSNSSGEEVKTHFSTNGFWTRIYSNENTKLGEAPSYGETIIMHLDATVKVRVIILI